MRVVSPKRVSRTYTQTLLGPPEAVFPLLCPVREADWIADWDPLLVVSESGVAEEDCVFVTRSEPENAVWYVTDYEPEKGFIAFVRYNAGGDCHAPVDPGRQGRRRRQRAHHLHPHQPRRQGRCLCRCLHRSRLCRLHDAVGEADEPLPGHGHLHGCVRCARPDPAAGRDPRAHRASAGPENRSVSSPWPAAGGRRDRPRGRRRSAASACRG